MLKIQIKSKNGKVLFEYEKENNTIKDTVEEAVKQCECLKGANLYGVNLEEASLCGANLKGAHLEGANLYRANLKGTNLQEANLKGAHLEGTYLYGANLKGAHLEGTYLYITDSDLEKLYEGNEAIKKFEEQTNINIIKTHINKHILSPYYLIYWKNGLIIDKYEYKEPIKKMTLEQIKQELGYDFELVKKVEEQKWI